MFAVRFPRRGLIHPLSGLQSFTPAASRRTPPDCLSLVASNPCPIRSVLHLHQLVLQASLALWCLSRLHACHKRLNQVPRSPCCPLRVVALGASKHSSTGYYTLFIIIYCNSVNYRECTPQISSSASHAGVPGTICTALCLNCNTAVGGNKHLWYWSELYSYSYIIVFLLPCGSDVFGR